MSTATISAPLALPSSAKASPSAPSTSPLDFAIQQILANKRKKEILADLTARYYLSAENALAIVNHAYALKHAAFRKAGVEILLKGVAMAFFGVLLTAAGASLAKGTGGVFLVFWGLVLVGGINIVKGLFRIIVG